MSRAGTVAVIAVLLGVSWAWARPDTTPRTYVLTIDEQPFELAEGKARTITLKSGTQHRLRLQRKATQKLRVANWEFEYPSAFSADRDGDGDVSLVSGGGIGIAVTDHGAGDLSEVRGVYNAIMRNFVQRQRRGVVKDLRKTPPVVGTLPSAKVLRGTLEYSDEDGDRMTFDASVVHARGQILSALATFETSQSAAARASVQTVLDSLAVR
ncbi:MAG: hypothetical protein GY946_33735 [bacterium]|nr:hypothetical protein [bacterium]